MNNWETLFEAKMSEVATSDDPAHDLLHFRRVVQNARRICVQERGNLAIVIPAAWLHDFVNVPKNDPRRAQASRLSAEAALDFLKSIQFPEDHFPEIAHAIEAHSFSANIVPQSLEAKIVQDADRLDGLGAIGIARCFATAGVLKRPFYEGADPFCVEREPDDLAFTVDHFYKKLFKVSETLQTESGKEEGSRRIQAMRNFLKQFQVELQLSDEQ